jgi:hypothetical protein
MTSTVVAALADVLGLAIGRFWDRRSESSRWQRDQRAAVMKTLYKPITVYVR